MKPSSLFEESVDKASFFRTPEDDNIKTKSPLEQLIEAEDEQATDIVEQEDISLETLETELNALTDDLKSYTPQDLASSTFIISALILNNLFSHKYTGFEKDDGQNNRQRS